MDSVVSHIYIIPRQLFRISTNEAVVGPAGLSLYFGRASGEDGCYAVVLRGENIFSARVYGTNQAYDCFSPIGAWEDLGLLSDVRCFCLLFEKEHAFGRDQSISFWGFVSGGDYRIMYAMQAAPSVVYVRLRSPRMPDDLYAVYRLYGIADKDAWWTAPAYAYKGILSVEAADADLDDV